MATQVMANNRMPFVDRVLSANGMIVTTMGATLLVGAYVLPTILGLSQALVIAVGIMCVVVGPLVLWLVATNRVTRQIVLALGIVDAAWAAASIAALAFGWLQPTSVGWWAVVLQADIIAIFAALEFYALRKK